MAILCRQLKWPHGITPQSIVKAVQDVMEGARGDGEGGEPGGAEEGDGGARDQQVAVQQRELRQPEGEEVDDSIREVAFVVDQAASDLASWNAILELRNRTQNRLCTMALGELFATARRQHIWRVHKNGWLPLEGTENLDVLWQTWQPVIPAEDVGNLHVVVIHHRRKMVRRKTIRLQNNEVILRGGIPLHVAMEEIIRFDHATCRHFDAHHRRLTRRDACSGIGERRRRLMGHPLRR